MLGSPVLVIPAEGDSVETERWYMRALRHYYRDQRLKVYVFDYGFEETNVALGVVHKIEEFFEKLHPNVRGLEIHAQGGFGAYVAYMMMSNYGDRIKRVFFVGGAPSKAMTLIAKWFHLKFADTWYRSRVPFFADDPNPENSLMIDKIKRSSTEAMRKNPLLYRNQLIAIGSWDLLPGWRPEHNCDAWFVPNGDAPFPKWWNNTYNNTKAVEEWLKHGVQTTRRPGDGFSFYSMMPAGALFKVMDEVRQFSV